MLILIPFGDYGKTDAQPDEMGQTIPCDARGGVGGGGVSTWEPKQETSFGGMSLRMKVLRECIECLY